MALDVGRRIFQSRSILLLPSRVSTHCLSLSGRSAAAGGRGGEQRHTAWSGGSGHPAGVGHCMEAVPLLWFVLFFVLGLVVDSCEFVVILLFRVLIFFFLHKSL